MCFLVSLSLSLVACSGDATNTAGDGAITNSGTDATSTDSIGASDDDVGNVPISTTDVGPVTQDAEPATEDSGGEPTLPNQPDTIDSPTDTEATPPEAIPWLDEPVWQCDNGVPVSAVIDVVIPANAAGCPWNDGDNMNPTQGTFAAHERTLVTTELPGPSAAICGVNLESATFDPDFEQPFVYDDHFVLAFNDIVLLASYGDLLDALPQDRNLYLFDWSAIAGADMNFNNNSAYCLGYGSEDSVECSVPAPESNGPMAYSVGGGLGAALSGRAVQEQRIEFMLVTFGDNDPDSDCRNSELRMQVVVDYVIQP